MSEGITPGPIKPQTLERKHSKFLLLHTDAGTFGVLKDYPHAEQVLAQIAENPVAFTQEDELAEGHREKFYLTLTLPDGTTTECIVKGKVHNQIVDMIYPNAPDYGHITESKNRKQHSVTNEITAGKEATDRYRAKYGEELSIEKPVGFFISQEEGRKGMRWTIFEKLNDIVFDYDAPKYLETRRYEFAQEMQKRLATVEVYTNGSVDDVVMVGDPQELKNLKFVLVDTEEWSVKPMKNEK